MVSNYERARKWLDDTVGTGNVTAEVAGLLAIADEVHDLVHVLKPIVEALTPPQRIVNPKPVPQFDQEPTSTDELRCGSWYAPDGETESWRCQKHAGHRLREHAAYVGGVLKLWDE